MELYEHIKTFDVKYCDVDFKDELKPSAVLAYLEEVACSSADELGFGYSYLKPRSYAFMLTNIRCEFLAPVPLGEHISVKTWPTPPSYVVFGREYQILSARGDGRFVKRDVPLVYGGYAHRQAFAVESARQSGLFFL